METPRPRWDIILPLAVTIVVFAGNLKGSRAFAWLPFDLTALTAAVVWSVTAVTLLTHSDRVRDLRPVLLTVLAFSPALTVTSLIEYSGDKVVRFVTITLVCSVAPLILCRSQRRAWWIIRSFVVLGLLIVILARLDPVPQAVDRLVGDGSNTIAVARAAGGALVGLVMLALAKKLNWAIVGIVSLPLITTIFATGSRGPLIAAFPAIAVAVLARGQGLRGWIRVVALALLGGTAGAWALANASIHAADRFRLLLADDHGTSVNEREHLFRESVRLIGEHPLGVGWGDFREFFTSNSGEILSYSHNAVLETYVEGGWIAGTAFVLLLVGAAHRAYSSARQGRALGAAVLGLLFYCCLNAFVSGDLNDNRGMFLMVGLALVLPLIEATPDMPREKALSSRANADGRAQRA